MSNHLAIATVTAALKKRLQAHVSQDIPGAQVTTLRPESPGGNVSGACINLFLYHAAPNTAWRNADLRTRRPKGDLVKHGQASLDLHYLLTFYGNEQRLEPQRLMGSAVQTLIDHPQLNQQMIREAISDNHELEDSTLEDQVQLVRFFPSELTTEELTRIWSIFFQIPYSLSFAYRGTAVMIQGRAPGQAALPVRSRQFYLSSTRPVIDRIKTTGALNEPITLSSHLVIQGRELQANVVQVQIGEARITPQTVSNNTIEVAFSQLPEAQRNTLRAGAQGLKVIHIANPSLRTSDSAAVSNLLSVVLCPTIQSGDEGVVPSNLRKLDIVPSNLRQPDSDQYAVTVTVQVDTVVGPTQSIYLLLNSTQNQQDTYVIKGRPHAQSGENAEGNASESNTSERDTSVLTFQVESINLGTYLVRVQIEGAESPLEVSETGLHIGPLLTLEQIAEEAV